VEYELSRAHSAYCLVIIYFVKNLGLLRLLQGIKIWEGKTIEENHGTNLLLFLFATAVENSAKDKHLW
jgi:hypothetical protein